MGIFAVSPILMALGFGDPAPGLMRSKAASANWECQRLTAEEAARLRPGVIQAPKPRGDFGDRSVLICGELLMRPGVRTDLEEAVLANLEERASDLASAAHAAEPDPEERTWLVEAHFPSVQASTKLSFAVKNALMRLGVPVSDRIPFLGAGDIDVITRMPPERSYAAACQRYADNGTLHEGDTLLAVIAYDLRATSLYAGLCRDGHWRWLR